MGAGDNPLWLSHIAQQYWEVGAAVEPNLAFLFASFLPPVLQFPGTQTINSSLVADSSVTDVCMSRTVGSGLPRFDRACKRDI